MREWLVNPSIWIMLAIALFIIEIFTFKFYLLWFAIGAFFTGFISFFWQSPMHLLFIFLSISIILLIFARPSAKKWFAKKEYSQ